MMVDQHLSLCGVDGARDAVGCLRAGRSAGEHTSYQGKENLQF
jgi:hypothetical protein